MWEEKNDSPNTADILPDLVRVCALKLAQLRISLDLEEHLLAILRCHLCAAEAKPVSTKTTAQRTSTSPNTDVVSATRTRRQSHRRAWDDTGRGRTYLDIDGRVSVLLLGFSVLGRPRLLVGHVVYEYMRVDGR